MKIPNRYKLVGEYEFVGLGKVLDAHKNEEFDAELRFNAINVGIESNEIDGGREVAVNLDVVKNAKANSLWEIVIKNDEKKTVSDTFDKYKKSLVKISKQSEGQVDIFFERLIENMETKGIVSLDDLLARYESIDRNLLSEQTELLREIVGLYHLNNLMTLVNLLEKEKSYNNRIDHNTRGLEKLREAKDCLCKCSDEYEKLLNQELEIIKSNKFFTEQLIELFK